MSRIDHTIDVNVPLRAAYNQWTQFEDFPHFMDGVERVVQLDDETLEWTATIAGQTRTWRARIVDQVPDERIAWVATSGVRNDGIVTFLPLDADRTRVSLAIEVRPEGPIENIGAALGLVSDRVAGDLQRFRDFIEQRGQETGAWRGSIPDEVEASVAVPAAAVGGRREAAAPAGVRAEPVTATASGPRRTAEMAPREAITTTAAGRRADIREEASGRGFATGQADPRLTREPTSEVTDRSSRTEATGRGFAEGQADPDLTREPVREVDDRSPAGEATGRGFAEGQADPDSTRDPVSGVDEVDSTAEATGRGFAEGQADPDLTREDPEGIRPEPGVRREVRRSGQ